ncbi:type II secretion system F family protein [Arcanobacterium canis]
MMWMLWGALLLGVIWVSVPPVRSTRTNDAARETRPQRHVFLFPRRERKTHELDMGMLMTQVATRLRSGATIEHAWASALESVGLGQLSRFPAGADGSSLSRLRWKPRLWRGKNRGSADVGHSVLSMTRTRATAALDDDGIPVVLMELWNAGAIQRRKLGVSAIVEATLPATFAVCRMGNATGAPMAEILETCADGITETGEAKSARDVALAGPITSARMLAALPIFGIFLASMLGISVIEFAHTTVGKAVLGAGVFFELAGIWTVVRMVKNAQEKEVVE